MTTRWPMLRILLTAHLSFVVVGWLALAVLVATATAGVAAWGQVDRSLWHYAASQTPRWLAFGLGMDAINTYLRIHVAHGRTRGDFLRQLFPHLVVVAVALAAMVVIGYLIDHGVFALADWPARAGASGAELSTTDILGFLGPHALMLLLWGIAGAMLTAAFTRNLLLGLLVVPIGLLILAPSELLVEVDWIPGVYAKLTALGLPAGTSVGVSLAMVAVGCGTLWRIVRDTPVRPKVA